MSDTDSLTERLRAAVQAVEAAGVPDDLREVAFSRALDSLLGVASPPAAPPPSGTSGASSASAGATGASADGPLAKLAETLGIDSATAEKVYDIDEDGLHLVLSPTKLGGVTTAMERIARLVVAGRQAAGLDEGWTSIDVVRAVCENRGKYSAGNFSTYVKKLDGAGFRIKGAGASREFKANAQGFEETGTLVKQLAGQE
jgi:hypothetical protein